MELYRGGYVYSSIQRDNEVAILDYTPRTLTATFIDYMIDKNPDQIFLRLNIMKKLLIIGAIIGAIIALGSCSKDSDPSTVYEGYFLNIYSNNGVIHEYFP